MEDKEYTQLIGKMSNDEVLSSTILSNVDIITDIYKIIKESGLRAVKSESVIKASNDVFVIKPNINGVTRVTANCRRPGEGEKDCRKSNKYSIEYDPNDIMIVGGSALNVYDYALKGLKERRGLSTLESYIKKKTSDIDIVWWPREVKSINNSKNVKDEIVTSSSPAIQSLIKQLQIELTSEFEKNRKDLETKIRPFINNATNDDSLTIELGGNKYYSGQPIDTWQAGTWTIVITFKMKTKQFKICEVIIHDSGSSQRVDENGNEIKELRYMSEDPVYCSPTPEKINSMSILDINGVDIAVPNILTFVKQQLLAFGNNIKSKNQKAFINYKRIQFIKNLLNKIVINDNSNKADLLEVFKTDNSDYPRLMVSHINAIEKVRLTRLYKDIIDMCKTYNASNDSIISQLCIEAERIENFEKQKVAAENARRNAAERLKKFQKEENAKIPLLQTPAPPKAPTVKTVQSSQNVRYYPPTPPPMPPTAVVEVKVNPYSELLEYIDPYTGKMIVKDPMTLRWRPLEIAPIKTDPTTGILWYTHPDTGDVIIKDPKSRFWRPRDPPPPPPMPVYQVFSGPPQQHVYPVFSGPPSHYQGYPRQGRGYGKTYKNKKNNNTTKKRI